MSPYGRNVQVSCLFAPYTGVHRSAIDRKPSMGILALDDKQCVVHCFTCGWRAHALADLFLELSFFDERFKEFLEEAAKIDDVSLDSILAACRGYAAWLDEGVAVKPAGLPEETYKEFAGLYHPYLARRGITKETARVWEAGFDRSRMRVTFPVRTKDGGLRGAVGRGIHEGVSPPYWNYWEFDKSEVLFGAHLVSKGAPLVVCEGPVDTVYGWQLLSGEFSVVGTMGAEFSPEQADLMVDLADEVIEMFDSDAPGRKAAGKLARMIGRRARFRTVTWPDLGKKLDPGSALSGEFDLVEVARSAVLATS